MKTHSTYLLPNPEHRTTKAPIEPVWPLMKCLLDRLETLDGKEEIGFPIDFMPLVGFPEMKKNMPINVRNYFDVIQLNRKLGRFSSYCTKVT